MNSRDDGKVVPPVKATAAHLCRSSLNGVLVRCCPVHLEAARRGSAPPRRWFPTLEASTAAPRGEVAPVRAEDAMGARPAAGDVPVRRKASALGPGHEASLALGGKSSQLVGNRVPDPAGR